VKTFVIVPKTIWKCTEIILEGDVEGHRQHFQIWK